MKGNKRSLLLALILCCVSAVALAGIYRREKEQEDEWDQLVDLSEADESSLPSEEEVSALVKATEEDETDNDKSDKDTGEADTNTDAETEDETEASYYTDETNAEEIDDVDDLISSNEENKDDIAEDAWDEQEEAMAQIAPAPLDFNENTILTWPLQGEVLMEYSMDKTVYFPTLQQYKYNPGLLIQGEEGAMVYAGADGVVTKIEQSDELGLMVTIDLGNSYAVTYGQLKALKIEEGSGVSDGSLIGLVAAPTKYYSVEGDHVYMELTKDGQPIDPLDYLD